MINTTRHNEIFQAINYKDTSICIVGLGAIGSRVAENLVSFGLTNIVFIDYDIVEDHNLANQIYIREHIGEYKTDALAMWCHSKVGDSSGYYTYTEEITEESELKYDIIISCVDTFKARQLLFDKAKEAWADVFFDTRMAALHTAVFCVDMEDDEACKKYLATIGDDDSPDYETSACGSSLTVGATAQIAGACCAMGVMNYLKTGFIDPVVRIHTSPFNVRNTYAY